MESEKNEAIRKIYERMREEREKQEEENSDGFEEVVNKKKRKKDSPEKQNETKKGRRFTPEKAGKEIFKIIKRKDLSDTESEDEVSENENEKEAEKNKAEKASGTAGGDPPAAEAITIQKNQAV